MKQTPAQDTGASRNRISKWRLVLTLLVCIALGVLIGLQTAFFPVYFADAFHGLPPSKVTWSEWRSVSVWDNLKKSGWLLDPERFTEIRDGRFETWDYTFEIYQVREAGNESTEQYIPYRNKATLKVAPVAVVYAGLVVLLVLGILWSRRPARENP